MVPAELEIDTFDGTAWAGVVPFDMGGIAPRFLPPVPGLSGFPEINLRTYVTHRGTPGVWFVSLDASSAIGVWVARRFFHLPYFAADMAVTRDGDAVHYRSVRKGNGDAPAFDGRYRPTDPPARPLAGSVEHFLTERYCLYTTTRSGRLLRGDVHHGPWPLQPAEAEFAVNTIGSAQGVALDGPPLLHFSRSTEVALWLLREA